MRIVFDLHRGNVNWLRRSRMLAWAIKPLCEALVRINTLFLLAHPETPPLYQSGVRYQNEPKGQTFEEFAPIPTLLERKWGDCDDLAPWRVAELRVRHKEKARIRVQWKRIGPNKEKLFHIVVRRADGTIEDPCRILGMR